MPQFLILANDYQDTDALSRRLSVREEHLKRVREEKLQGKFILGGAKLNQFNQMQGSMMLVEMEDENAVRQWLDQDPYVTARVWEEIQILPFRIADV